MKKKYIVQVDHEKADFLRRAIWRAGLVVELLPEEATVFVRLGALVEAPGQKQAE